MSTTKRDVKPVVQRSKSSVDRLAYLEECNRGLIEALKFYANPQKYKSSVVHTVTKVDQKARSITLGGRVTGPVLEWRYDNGDRAREALKKWGGE